MENLLQLIQNWLVWAYPIVFVAMLLENLGLPLPGQTVATVAAILAGQNQLNIGLVFILAVAGGTVGSIGGYWLGRRGGRDVLVRFGKYFFVTTARLETAEIFFDRHGAKALIVSRYLPVICFSSGLLSGIARLNFRRFCLATLLGVTLWCATHLTLGFVLGRSLDLLIQVLNGVGIVAVILVALVVAIVVYKTKFSKKKLILK